MASSIFVAILFVICRFFRDLLQLFACGECIGYLFAKFQVGVVEWIKCDRAYFGRINFSVRINDTLQVSGL